MTDSLGIVPMPQGRKQALQPELVVSYCKREHLCRQVAALNEQQSGDVQRFGPQ